MQAQFSDQFQTTQNNFHRISVFRYSIKIFSLYLMIKNGHVYKLPFQYNDNMKVHHIT